jgi:hypothetical protein
MRAALALLALLAATAGAAPQDAPVAATAQAPVAVQPAPFECPQEGLVAGATAPPDYHAAPDARCVAGGLVTLYGANGKPFAQMTRVGPGWYLTSEGYRAADGAFRRVQRERDAARAELAARQPPGVPVREAPAVTPARWTTPVLVGVAVTSLLVGGLVGCRVAGGCR